MTAVIYTFFVGLAVSFFGTLPLGTINVAALQITSREGRKSAFQFTAGAVLMEMVYLRLVLKGIGWLVGRTKLFNALGWVTVGLLLALAVASFIAAFHKHESKNVLLNNRMNRYLLGAFMNLLNPAQLPFWFGWCTYLITNRALGTSASDFNIFTGGAAVGTILALLIFIYGGNWVVKKLNANQRKLDIGVGVVFAITALIQAWRVLHP